MGTHWKCLKEIVRWSTHKICFWLNKVSLVFFSVYLETSDHLNLKLLVESFLGFQKDFGNF